MNFKEIKELIAIFSSESTIDELEVERSGTRIRFKRSGSIEVPMVDEIASKPLRAPVELSETDSPPAEDNDLIQLTSPIVGTFYRSPSPDADPFVVVGDTVDKGATVCIIEAMKLMNEIEAETSGEIVSIFVQDGHPVEYGEPLFAIRPS